MKKILSVLLAVFMIVSNTYVVFANENVELNAYTTNTEGFDDFASATLSSYIYGYYGSLDTSLKLGKGIYVFGETTEPIVVYPIWKENNIVATFKVAFIDNVYTGTYSENNANQLNYIKDLTIQNPLRLFVMDNEFYMNIGNEIYDAEIGEGNEIEIEIDVCFPEDSFVVNSGIFLDYDVPNIPRYPTSYNSGWSFSDHDASSTWYCYAYCLAGMLTNLGYSAYNYDRVIDDFQGDRLTPLPATSFLSVKNYLQNQGFSMISSSTGSGYLSFSSACNYIYGYDTYILAGLRFNGTEDKHFGVIVGYSTLNGVNTYTIYDPRSSGNGMCSMSATTRKFTNSDSEVFVWDSGYITKVIR